MASQSFSQQGKHLLVDSFSHDPIPYASLFFTKSDVGFYTDSNGSFELDNTWHQQDTLLISCMGYKSISIDLKKLINDTLFLVPQIEYLEEVTVVSPIIKTRFVGYGKKTKKISWPLRQGDQIGVLMKLTTEGHGSPVRIKTIQIPVDKRRFMQQGGENIDNLNFNTIVKVNLYTFCDDKPCESLLKKPIIINYNQESSNVISIDLTEKNIFLPNDGIFLAIEMVRDPMYLKSIQNDNKLFLLPKIGFTNRPNKDVSSITYQKSIFTENWEKFDFKKLELDKVGIKNIDFKVVIGMQLEIKNE